MHPQKVIKRISCLPYSSVLNNDDIMALYGRPSPFEIQQSPGSNMQQSQMFMPTAGYPMAHPNVMSTSQPSFQQFPTWAKEGLVPITQPIHHTPVLSSPPAQQKPTASSAFDDLFATATAHFSSVPQAASSQNNFAQKAPATTTSAAHQDLESLFM